MIIIIIIIKTLLQFLQVAPAGRKHPTNGRE